MDYLDIYVCINLQRGFVTIITVRGLLKRCINSLWLLFKVYSILIPFFCAHEKLYRIRKTCMLRKKNPSDKTCVQNVKQELLIKNIPMKTSNRRTSYLMSLIRFKIIWTFDVLFFLLILLSNFGHRRRMTTNFQTRLNHWCTFVISIFYMNELNYWLEYSNIYICWE